MLFNSYGFIFVFLPITLAGFFLSGRSTRAAASWLVAASLFFYGYWNPVYLPLLLGSIAFNYFFGVKIARADSAGRHYLKRLLLTVSICLNLGLLGYYKYANFFLSGIDALSGSSLPLGKIILPLGISFFTFTQIAFLVDTGKGMVKEYNFLHYVLFVTYFPHLIAGPVLHHREMMPQFSRSETYRFDYGNMAVGLAIFFIGLFKKTVLADGISIYVGPVFQAAGSGGHPGMFEAWMGALCYAFQIYFDFSGYSDMAIGLSRMFGITLPLNFDSPYKAVNIIEFWRRWHMTLSRFLRDYLYIPLGGNRKGKARRYSNLIATMLLGGLWHGAGWTFLVWGGLHGIYLVINHGWHALRRRFGQDTGAPISGGMRALSILATFMAVTVAWVFFRSDNMETALAMLKAMSGMNGMGSGGISRGTINWLWILLLITWLAPNTQQIMRDFRPALDVHVEDKASKLVWQPGWRWLAAHVALALFGVISISKVSEFIYFQF